MLPVSLMICCFNCFTFIIRVRLWRFSWLLRRYLVTLKKLDATLLESEREAVRDCCNRRDRDGLNKLMRDLYTHSMKRTKIVDAMLNEDVDSAREGFKKVYYSHMGHKVAPRTKAGGTELHVALQQFLCDEYLLVLHRHAPSKFW